MKKYIEYDREKLRSHRFDAATHVQNVINSGHPWPGEVISELILEQKVAQCKDLLASMRSRINRWPWPVRRLSHWALTKLIPDHIAESNSD